jgi:hypothetical protein
MSFAEYKADRQFESGDLRVSARKSKEGHIFHCLSINGEVHTFLQKDLVDPFASSTEESRAITGKNVSNAIRSGNAIVLVFTDDVINEESGEVKRQVRHLLCGGEKEVKLDI